MAPQTIKCPACGATHDVLNPGVIGVIYDYGGR